MKRILTFLLLLILFSSSPAQFFEVTFEDTIGHFNAPGTFFLAGWLKNITNEPLHIKSIRLENNLPDTTWTTSMCIYVCFPDTLDSVTTLMTARPIAAGDSEIVDVVFSHTDSIPIPGTATVLIKYATMDDAQVEYQWFEASSVITNIAGDAHRPISEFKLLNNYPNPFNNQTIISAGVVKAANVSLQIFDVLGREVYTTNQETSSAGEVTFRWSGLNNNGEELSSGVYFYRVIANSHGEINQSQIKKLTLLR